MLNKGKVKKAREKFIGYISKCGQLIEYSFQQLLSIMKGVILLSLCATIVFSTSLEKDDDYFITASPFNKTHIDLTKVIGQIEKIDEENDADKALVMERRLVEKMADLVEPHAENFFPVVDGKYNILIFIDTIYFF